MKALLADYGVVYEGYGDEVFAIEKTEIEMMWEDSQDLDEFLESISEYYKIGQKELKKLWTDNGEKTPVGSSSKTPVGSSKDKAKTPVGSSSVSEQECITITFGDQAENHVGMEKIGEAADEGFSVEDLEASQQKWEELGYECVLVRLDEFIEEKVEPAAVLIVRGGVNALLEGVDQNSQDLLTELKGITWDSKAFMYGRVVNKNARHNVCFYETSQEPDYEAGKGRIIAYEDVPLLKRIRSKLPKVFGKKAKELVGEGNYYYDVKKCGIGFHGDSERKKVIALRVGNSPPLHYQWFQNSSPVGERIILDVHDGDMYTMSEKAVGFDWKRKKNFTLRHATGCKKFTEK